MHSDQPQGQPHDVVQRRQTMFQSFTGQYMRDVGLETWVQNHGGMSAVLELVREGGRKLASCGITAISLFHRVLQERTWTLCLSLTMSSDQ